MPLNVSIVNIANLASSATATSGTTNLTRPVRTDERGIGSERFGAGKRALLSVLRGDSDVAGTMAGSLGTVGVFGSDVPAAFGVVGAPPLGNAFASTTTPVMQLFSGDGTTTRFQTNIPFVTFANYNWIVESTSFKLSGTVTVAAGVVTGSSTNFDPELDVGDAVMLGGQVCVCTARTSDTAAVVSPAITVTAGSTGYNMAQNKWVKAYNDTEVLPQEYAVDDVGGYAVIDFGIAPPAVTDVPGAQASNIAVYYKVPTEILATGANVNVRTGIRSRTMIWTNWLGNAGDDFNATRVDLEVSTAS